MKKLLCVLIAALGLLGPLQLRAQPAPAPATSTVMTEGEIRKVDKEAQKITIRHGPIVNLDMAAMTMVFRAADPALLDGVRVGDKVRFRAEDVGGVITVTKMESAN